ncbi:venom protease-like [Hylaeus anthracinus]|uniref:venom protease-like n=1 Tax=Hylaeus anthracinus TaxID=313031 RepID=UPI0023B90A37|nr:venom protease-like [Hylaeus anthracinus]
MKSKGRARSKRVGPTSDILMQVQVPVVSVDDCAESYNDNYAKITNSSICAGYSEGGKSACQGDSGGPLMYGNDTTFYQIGVVSFGYKCGQPKYPDVYTRITEFLDFITSAMKQQ